MRTIIALALALSTTACMPEAPESDDGASDSTSGGDEELAAAQEALTTELAAAPAALAVGISVSTRLDRRWVWDMTVDNPAPIVLAPGAMTRVSFPLHIRNTGVVDTNHRVEGTIRLANTALRVSVIAGVFAVIGETVVPVVCPRPFPIVLPAGSSLGCTYAAALANGRDRTMAVVSYGTEVSVATALVRFTTPTTVVKDYDRVVEATAAGVGHVYLTDAKFEPSVDTSFSREIGPFPCGPFAFNAFAQLRALSGAGSTPSGLVMINRTATASGTVVCVAP